MSERKAKSVWTDRLTAKDRGLVVSAIKRAFSRSELRKAVLNESIVEGHTDLSRPRVKTWCRCACCGKLDAKSYMQVDHIDPIIPVNLQAIDLTPNEIVLRTWCDKSNLQALNVNCHKVKSAAEMKERSRYRKLRKKGIY